MTMKREDLEAAGRAVGEEMALSLSNVGMNLDSKSWEKWNAARKAARRGTGKSQVGSAANSEKGKAEPLSGKKTATPKASTTAHRSAVESRSMDEAMAEFGADDDQATARARLAGSGAGRNRVVPDAPALSTPRPINGTLRSEMDRNVVTVPSYREGALKSGALIKKYIESGRDVRVIDVNGSGTVSITDFAPGTTMVFRYDGMRKVGTLKVPNMTKPWDGTEEAKPPRRPDPALARAVASGVGGDGHVSAPRRTRARTGKPTPQRGGSGIPVTIHPSWAAHSQDVPGTLNVRSKSRGGS